MSLRTKTVFLSAAFLSVACFSSPSQPDTAEWCLDEKTELRDFDEKCEQGDQDHHWVYGQTAPAVGSRGSNYSTVKTGIVGRAPIGGGTAGSSSDGGSSGG